MSDDDTPSAYSRFIERFPHIGEAWNKVREQERSGPLDEKARRLVKLGIAIGGQGEGSVHSAVRKALDAGAKPEAIRQVVAMAASTIGFPNTVKVLLWVEEQLEDKDAT